MKSEIFLLLDLDGVLVSSKNLEPFPDAPGFLGDLQNTGFPYFIATNNSRIPPGELVRSLRSKGFALTEDRILTPFPVLSDLLLKNKIQQVRVIGEDRLKEFVFASGFSPENSVADAVLVGYDTVWKPELLSRALEDLQKGAILISMNRAVLVRDPSGKPMPGPMAVARMLAESSRYGKEILCAGKGCPEYDRVLLNNISREKRKIVFVSDDPWKDLASYQKYGFFSVFLTTGKYREPDLVGSVYQPDRIVNSLSELREMLFTRPVSFWQQSGD